MSQRIGQWLLYVVLITMVLVVEQTYGLPLVFLALSTLATSAWGAWFKQAWLLLIGVLLATLYGLPLGGGVLLLLATYVLWLVLGAFLKNLTLRLLLVGSAGVIVLAVSVGFIVTSTTLLLLLVSAGILMALTKIVAFVPEVNSSNFIRQWREVRIKTT
jgi:hypothetical protein